jgi:hypothetical protein
VTLASPLLRSVAKLGVVPGIRDSTTERVAYAYATPHFQTTFTPN